MQCNNCKGKFEPPENMVLTACPFCQTEISSEDKMLALVEKHSTEIYNDIYKFAEVLGEYFKGYPLCELLQALAINETSVYLYNIKDTNTGYGKALKEVSAKTFIVEETLAPAFELLYIGLGLKSIVEQYVEEKRRWEIEAKQRRLQEEEDRRELEREEQERRWEWEEINDPYWNSNRYT